MPPVPVHQNPGCEWIDSTYQPLGQIQTVGFAHSGSPVQAGQQGGRSRIHLHSSTGKITPQEYFCLPGHRALGQNHGGDGRLFHLGFGLGLLAIFVNLANRLELFLGHHRWHQSQRWLILVIEKGKQLVILSLGNRIELVVMALGASNGEAEPNRAGCSHPVDD